jgi:RNA-binding protein 16
MKERQWKDYWDVEMGVSYIPHEKLDHRVNLVDLEEGGTFDEETLPDWIRNIRAPAMAGAQAAPSFMPEQLSGGPPPGFVRLPAGLSPAIGGQADATHIPVPGGTSGQPPPGLPPFGLPPVLAQAGLLPAPGALIPGAGLLGAPGAPRLVAPPGILLPRFGLQPPPLSGPPSFPPPAFDISQPPPGLRPPFGHLAAPAAVVSEAGSDDMDIDQVTIQTTF